MHSDEPEQPADRAARLALALVAANRRIAQLEQANTALRAALNRAYPANNGPRTASDPGRPPSAEAGLS